MLGLQEGIKLKFQNEWFQDVNDVSETIIDSAFTEIDDLLQIKYELIMKRIRRDNEFWKKGNALVFVLRQLDQTLKDCQGIGD